MKQTFYLFVLIIAFVFRLSAEGVPAERQILEYVHERFGLFGELKNEDGFIYIDIDDGFIHELIPFIQEEGFQEPPYFGPGMVGAHISVIFPKEMRKYRVGPIDEIGRTYLFKPVECRIAHPHRFGKEVYVISVEAPELDDLRQKYGLPKKMFDFHITLGVRLEIKQAA